MSDIWSVNNPAVDEATQVLFSAVRASGTILADLSKVLAQVAAATQNSAVPLWEGLAGQWTSAYDDMTNRLSLSATAGSNAHLAYLDGDRQSVRIMM